LRQIQGQRFFQDHHVDALSKLRTDQILRKRNAALCAGHGRHEQGLQTDEHQYAVELRHAGAAVNVRRMHHGIDDECPDVGDAGGQQSGQQRQQRQCDAQRPVGGPDEFERATAIGKHAQESARIGALA
jgi:hypothetical protein